MIGTSRKRVCQNTISIKITWRSCIILPEPAWMNTPVMCNTVSESRLPIPLSPLGQAFLLPSPWLDSAAGIRHLVEHLVHPSPSFSRWFAQMVMVFKDSSFWKIAARHNMRSISFSGPENENKVRCFAISFLHDDREQFPLGVFCRDCHNHRFLLQFS